MITVIELFIYGSILALKILNEVHKNAKYDEYEE